MDWFRWWHGTVSDSKFRLVSKKTGQPLPVIISVWAVLLEYASEAPKCNPGKRRGDIGGFLCEACDAMLDLDEGSTKSVVSQFETFGLIKENRIANWDKRQPIREDDSTARTRKYRQSQKLNSDARERDETHGNTREQHVTHGDAREHDETQGNTTEQHVTHGDAREHDVTHGDAPDKEKKRKELSPPYSPPPSGDGDGGGVSSDSEEEAKKAAKRARDKERRDERNRQAETEMFGPDGIWKLWVSNRRGSKTDALKAYKQVCQSADLAPVIRAGVEQYMQSPAVRSREEVGETEYIKLLATWLRAKGWEEAESGAWQEPCQTWKMRHRNNSAAATQISRPPEKWSPVRAGYKSYLTAEEAEDLPHLEAHLINHQRRLKDFRDHGYTLDQCERMPWADHVQRIYYDQVFGHPWSESPKAKGGEIYERSGDSPEYPESDHPPPESADGAVPTVPNQPCGAVSGGG